jgi:hypothetical protein
MWFSRLRKDRAVAECDVEGLLELCQCVDKSARLVRPRRLPLCGQHFLGLGGHNVALVFGVA